MMKKSKGGGSRTSIGFQRRWPGSCLRRRGKRLELVAWTAPSDPHRTRTPNTSCHLLQILEPDLSKKPVFVELTIEVEGLAPKEEDRTGA
ncbi:hypothetical protein SDJN02_08089, partial [Cucurbita argyrosperma subsp. argyrosperma]